jgi:hypothetical protein
VKVIDPASEHVEQFTILGAWDFDIDKHIISYLSPIAQSLLTRKVGDEVEFELEGFTRRYRIDGIERYSSTPSAAPAGTLLQVATDAPLAETTQTAGQASGPAPGNNPA